MRFSFVVSAGLGYRIPHLFETNASFVEFRSALRLLRQQGFSGVEINLATTEHQILSRISEVVHREQIHLAAIGTGLLYLTRGDSFTARNTIRRRRALSAVKKVIQFASGENAVVIIGLIRGGTSVVVDSEPLSQALVECDGFASDEGARLALEAINRYETFQLQTAAETAQVIHDEKLRSTGLLLDTFHMNIEEQSIEETIRRWHRMLSHFHIADSNRLAPGRGHLRIERFLRILDEIQYGGYVSAEILPRPNNRRAVIDTAAFLRRNDFI